MVTSRHATRRTRLLQVIAYEFDQQIRSYKSTKKSITGGEVALGGEFAGGEINVNPCYGVCFNLSYAFGMSWKIHANLAHKKYVTE